MGTITYTGQLTVVSCWCGIQHAVPDQLWREAFSTGRTPIYCPLGHHGTWSSDNEITRLKAKLDRAEADAKWKASRLESERRSHAATKGQLTKTKKRVKAGACPCCNRTFVQLSRHMASKHPDYADPSPSVNDVA